MYVIYLSNTQTMAMESTLQLPARVEALSLSGLSAIPPEYVRPADERADLGDAFGDDHTVPRIPVVDISPFLADKHHEECVEAVRAAAADWGVMHRRPRHPRRPHGPPARRRRRLLRPPHPRQGGLRQRPRRRPPPGLRQPPRHQRQRAARVGGLPLPPPAPRRPRRPRTLAVWPAHPPDYVAATREFGRRIREVASALLAILSTGLLGPAARTRWRRSSPAPTTSGCSSRSTTTRGARSRSWPWAWRPTRTSARSPSSSTTACRACRCATPAAGSRRATSRAPSSCNQQTAKLNDRTVGERTRGTRRVRGARTRSPVRGRV
ncbi:hypothetical protein PVAP13_1NG005900 [Panicum virgatum]|uniref:Non-haem dioxygenase N-terminal domain-containing protein n=1 Tax=Panicum virgatum TaxID=38727 RepID=A0A8T0WGF3_PANVG|nr:hypothetical protein PVAP13_1NG005900 [Panicum virgatum]